MAISPTGAVPVPLVVFGSWVTEVAPESVPENISPDCQDVAYAPGGVGSRPCTDIVLGSPFPAGGVGDLIPTVVYAKSFKLPTGSIQNLYFDSNGVFYVEDVVASPGTYTTLFTSTPGSTCKSITQFGREYIAISDGLHGAEVPLQWDGTLLRRYTSDGPGASASVTSVALPPSQMAAAIGTTVSASPASADFTATANAGTPNKTLDQVFTWAASGDVASSAAVTLQSTITGTAGGSVPSSPASCDITASADSSSTFGSQIQLFTFSGGTSSLVTLSGVQANIAASGVNEGTVLVDYSTDSGATWTNLWTQTSSAGPSTLTISGPVNLNTLQIRMTATAQWLIDPTATITAEGIITSILATIGGGGTGFGTVTVDASFDGGATWTNYAADTASTGSHTVPIPGPFNLDSFQVRVSATSAWTSGADVTTEADITSVLATVGGGGNTLERVNNIVTANTETPHGLKVGYQAQISNVPDSNSVDVNQTSNSSVQNTYGSGNWSYVGTQWRSNFNPGSSALSNLTFQGFGFTIPSTATILGVKVSAELVSQASTAGTLSQVALWAAGAPLGSTKTPGTNFTTTVTQQAYGSAGDSWGAALTPSIVNDPGFGFAMAATCDSVRVFIGQLFPVTVYYTLSGSGTVAIVESIVINNETNPGLALVTTTEPHGLAPDEFVSIVGVEPGTVAAVSSAQWSSGVTTLETKTSHGLNPGSVVQVADVGTATGSTTFSFNGSFTIDTVPSPNQMTYSQVPITATDPDVINATPDTGSLVLSWPVPDTPTPTYFEVESAPTPTTFYVQVSYSDGTWTTGTVGFAWDGTFYVTKVLSATEFQYQQYGPNGSTSAVGTVTPFGQAAPGLHLMQTLWLTDEGAIPAPSPPVTLIANGGQYLSVTNIPIGPSYVKGRILAFTGAQPNVPGELPPFFYIPVTPQTEGQIIGTATQINDNTTTSIILDFSDNTLYAALGISIPGNTLANQIKLDGALGFGVYESRLQTWGQRNIVNNLLNMGFGGGYSALAPAMPLGWSGSGGTLVTGRFGGQAWSGAGNQLSQGFYEDAYGDPIAIGETTYALRCYFAGAGTITATISSASTGFSTTASITSAAAGWYEATFSAETPDNIPADFEFSFVSTGVVSELSLIDTETPYTETILWGAYLNNPEGIDGVSGQWGPEDDPSKVMDIGILRDTLYILTRAPSGRLHETTGSGVTEPSGWQVNEVAADCGILSAISLTHSQADDTTSSGGDDWMAWPTEGGAMIFGGGQPEKITQEIQPNWYDPTKSDTSIQINMEAALTVWGLNDPVQRLLMFGVPIGSATAPNKIYVLNYRNLGSAQAIAGSPPFHPSFAGKLIATDNSRKWAPWNLPMNGAVRMYRGNTSVLTLILLGGNGHAYGESAGFGNVYTLNPAKLTDDDYGQIYPYYITYFFLDPEKAQALQLAGGRILLAYLRAYIKYTGQVTASYYPDSLSNLWPLTTTRNVSPNAFFDQEFGGGQCTGDRIAIKISSSPITGTDNGFTMTRLTAYIKDAKMKIRGAAR